jgi:hypothetical protein
MGGLWPMIGLRRRRWHRGVFLAAGCYNLAWGALSVADPQWLFRLSGMTPLNHPQVFAALGMVVGLYGVLYLEVSRAPERSWLLAAVGFVGKLLGPAGLAYVILARQWPTSTVVLVLTNDVVWWGPFLLYLIDAWPLFLHGTGRSELSALASGSGPATEASFAKAGDHAT